ncbi:protein kinase family protein [Nocardioides sp.]|uniref:protein kinase family protein n=1 Tax=Nocardioides sp. TaxID=35761 RepID=UPI003783D87C
MPSSIRPGDVLADRYRLVDLLTESSGGRFWRAHDKVLERFVALHVVAADDERAEQMLEAARRSAAAHDRRLLRVLDADRTDGLVFVVNEWGSGDSLDIMLANEGPLSPRRAAWLVSEVAAAIAVGHEAGVAHGRLVPENVLVDHAGSVRVIGFAVDAALFGLGPGRPSQDVTDLGGVLYAALTGKWPGPSPSQVPAAPVVQGRVLRPRQVRAGIPRPLDQLCDEVVNPWSGHGSRLREVHDLASAQGIADYLAAFVGDPTGLAAAEAAAGHRDTTDTISLPAIPDPPARDVAPEPAPVPAPVPAQPPPPEPEPEAAPEPAPAPEPAREPEPAPDPTPEPEVDADPAPVAGPATKPVSGPAAEPAAEPAVKPSTELPTEAGLPIFHDEHDDVSWLSARSEPPPPPPAFEEPPERPLFAPEPAQGPVRRPRHPVPAAASAGYWPWDTGAGTGAGPIVEDEPDEDEPVPGRRWLRLAAAIAGCLLLLLAIVVAYNLGRGRTPLALPGTDSGDKTPSASPSTRPPAQPISGVTASDLDPQGSPPYDEHPELTPLAVDGKPETAWSTMTYDQNFGPGGLKTGVGLVLDLGRSYDVSSIDLAFVGAPTGYSLYVTDTAPTAVKGLTAVATGTADGPRTRVDLDAPATGRYVTVWLTSIPAVSDGFRGGVAEVTVRG